MNRGTEYGNRIDRQQPRSGGFVRRRLVETVDDREFGVRSSKDDRTDCQANLLSFLFDRPEFSVPEGAGKPCPPGMLRSPHLGHRMGVPVANRPGPATQKAHSWVFP